ncbi:zinc finger protein 135-like [Dunckerocampus dactyliophorus]|uniref:zinc finger protein 135-like n=1 Tax=Dunckerocampus dactyliophorus TaxID=161453 RepID=UPI002404A352|nr:zinc finger protein 135-like [Dunckerocampus dactyliophorus]
MLKELVKERLMVAVDEILALFERTIASYEEELSRTREEKERHRQQLEAVSKTGVVFHMEDVQGSSTLKQEYLQPPHVKEEEEEGETECLHGSEEVDLTEFPLTVVSLKTDGDGEAGQLLAPLSDSEQATSRSPEDGEAVSSDTDGEGVVRTRTDNKHSTKKTGKKRVTCSLCAKSFSNSGHLTRHMLTHTGEKPFSCPVCGKRFTQKVNMASHMRTHTGEKPFRCSLCGKIYSYKQTLAVHMRTHNTQHSVMEAQYHT